MVANKYVKANKFAQIIFMMLLLVYALARAYVANVTIKDLTSEPSLLDTMGGICLIIVWSLMCLASLYLIYVACMSIRLKSFPSMYAIIPFRVKQVYGAYSVVFSIVLIAAALLMVMVAVTWVNHILNTITEIRQLEQSIELYQE